jgi:putative FmdB family regulatory protein
VPAYDYRCDDCGERFAIRVSISAYSSSATVACIKCGSPSTTRQLGLVSISVRSASRAGSAPVAGCGSSGFT